MSSASSTKDNLSDRNPSSLLCSKMVVSLEKKLFVSATLSWVSVLIFPLLAKWNKRLRKSKEISKNQEIWLLRQKNSLKII